MCVFFSSNAAAFHPDGDVAHDRQAARCPPRFVLELSAVLNPLFCWSARLSAVKVPPREPDTRPRRRDDDTLRGGNPIVLPKGGVKEGLLFISRLLTLHAGEKL